MGLQDCRAAGLRGLAIERPSGIGIAKLQFSWAAGLWAAELWGCWAAGLRDCRAPRQRGCRAVELRGCRDVELWGCGLLGCGTSGMRGFVAAVL